jgi:hypothetical protein
MATITWRGNSASWSSQLSWQNFVEPGAGDVALFGSLDTSVATLGAPASIGGVDLVAGTQATVLLQSTLTLGGTFLLSGGTLDLASGGSIEGGTVDLAGGTVVATGGVADGVVWLGPLGDGLAITAATAVATEAAIGSLDVAGTLTLEGGSYDSVAFTSSTYATPSDAIDAAAGDTVTFGTATVLDATADNPSDSPGVMPVSTNLTLGGAGGFVNDGLIVSDLVLQPLAIASASFLNAGTIALDTSVVPDVQETFFVTGSGGYPVPVTLTFDQTLAPALLISTAAFSNTGTIIGQAATVTVTGASFSNSGDIAFGSAVAEMPIANTTTAYVGSVTLDSSLDIAASVTSFSNVGTIEAGSILFQNNLTLSQLGTVDGAVTLTGTFDLGGGTLDVDKANPNGSFTFTGTVENGTLVIDGGSLDTTGATLVGVTVLQQAQGVVLDVTSGTVTLDAVTTELAYTTAATVDQLTVVAGVVGTIDRIGARAAGVLTFGANTQISDTVAGSTLEIGGAGTFSDAGQITLAGAELDIATLDGSGTISLANGAALGIGMLESTSAITVAFGTGSNLLSLPVGSSGANALGLTLANLQSGDLIDFQGISSSEPIGDPFGTGGAGVQDDTLDVQGASGESASVALTGATAGLTFTVTSDAAGGTLVTVSCFRHGTRIATPRGEVAVQHLRIGDLVTTAHGEIVPIKWLGRRRYSAETVACQPQLRPVCIGRGALGNGLPRRPLYLSPLHGLLLRAPDVSEVVVPAAALVNGRSITRGPIAAVSYIHIELHTPEAVLAEGAAAETFVDCDSRCLFDNAAQFSALYPGDDGSAKWLFCAPRVEDGWLLEAIRAGLPDAPPPQRESGRLRGNLDRCADGVIEGWVMDQDAPETPVELEVVVGGDQVTCIVANRYRIDLDRAGLGRGGCAFWAELPQLDAAAMASVRLRSLRSGAWLGN